MTLRAEIAKGEGTTLESKEAVAAKCAGGLIEHESRQVQERSYDWRNVVGRIQAMRIGNDLV